MPDTADLAPARVLKETYTDSPALYIVERDFPHARYWSPCYSSVDDAYNEWQAGLINWNEGF